MRTECKTIYSINELSDEAKEKALQRYCEKHEYRYDEVMATLNKGLEVLGFQVINYRIDCSSANQSWVRYNFIQNRYGEEINELTGQRLYAYLVGISWEFVKTRVYSLHANGKKKSCYFSYKYDKCTKKRFSRILKIDTIDNCPLTGVWSDNDFLDPIVEFLKKPDTTTTFGDIVENCVHSLFVAMEKDYESELTMEYFVDCAEANEYEFYEDGTRY
jgi:hypothetical protein